MRKSPYTNTKRRQPPEEYPKLSAVAGPSTFRLPIMTRRICEEGHRPITRRGTCPLTEHSSAEKSSAAAHLLSWNKLTRDLRLLWEISQPINGSYNSLPEDANTTTPPTARLHCPVLGVPV